jgi:hypothetical protein
MMTSIANGVGETTPRSRPMLSTISSMSPRVFIRVPSADEFAQPMPWRARQTRKQSSPGKGKDSWRATAARFRASWCAQRSPSQLPESWRSIEERARALPRERENSRRRPTDSACAHGPRSHGPFKGASSLW